MFSFRKKANAASPHKTGFTLTEIAIVLGVIGTVLGGIWSAAAHVNNERNTARIVQQVMTVVGGVRATYGSKGSVEAGDLTQQGINAGWFSEDTLQPGNCPAGSPSMTTGSCAVGAFGGNITIGGQTQWCPAAAALCTPNVFSVAVWQNGTNNCSSIMSAFIANATADGLWAVYSDLPTPTAWGVSSSTSLADPRITTCGGNILLGFKL